MNIKITTSTGFVDLLTHDTAYLDIESMSGNKHYRITLDGNLIEEKD
jgi:hypothetical protein